MGSKNIKKHNLENDISAIIVNAHGLNCKIIAVMLSHPMPPEEATSGAMILSNICSRHCDRLLVLD